MSARPSPQSPAVLGPEVDRTTAKKLLLFLLATASASVIHYADNILRFAVYPEPAWDNARLTDAFWFVMTPFGVAAYLLYRRGRTWPALLSAYTYVAMNMVVLGHYLYAKPWRLPFVINGTILVEAVTAGCLLAYVAAIHATWRSRAQP